MTNEFTTKAQEAIGSALESARAAGNPGVTPLHLLNALLTQNEGIATALLDAVGADRKTIGTRARNALVALPSIQGSTAQNAQADQALMGVINDARKRAEKAGDAYVSTEHLMIALAASKSEAGTILSSNAATPNALEEALKTLRPNPITSPDPEGSFEAQEVRARPDRGCSRRQARPGDRS